MISSTLRRTAVVVALATAGATLVGSGAVAAEQTHTSLSIRAVKPAIAPGASSMIRGHLGVADGHAAGGKTIALEAKADGEDVFTPIGVAVTGNRGGVHLQVTPAVTTRYRWDFAGDAQNKASHSGVATVRVRTADHPPRRLVTSLSIRVKSPRVDADGADLITGRLRSHNVPLQGKWVLLLAREDGATKWSFEGANKTGGRGQVAFRVHPPTGTHYRLAFLGTQVFKASRSGVVHVAVRPNALTIEATPGVIDPGAPATVSGVLTNKGLPYAGQTVQLFSKVAGSGQHFALAGSAVSAADGSVSFPVAPVATSRYFLFLPHATGVPAAKSPIATVHVKAATSLSIRGKVTAKGFVVSGYLRGGGSALQGRKVTLQSQADGESSWTDVATKRTKKQGRVAFTRAPAAGTSYRLSYAGGARFAPCTSGVVTN